MNYEECLDNVRQIALSWDCLNPMQAVALATLLHKKMQHDTDLYTGAVKFLLLSEDIELGTANDLLELGRRG